MHKVDHNEGIGGIILLDSCGQLVKDIQWMSMESKVSVIRSDHNSNTMHRTSHNSNKSYTAMHIE